jgi:ribonuclease D
MINGQRLMINGEKEAMTQSYIKSITKEEMNGLEQEEFNGKIVMVTKQEEVDEAVAYLMQFPCVGFDTETRPCFKKGQYFKISLMQIATEDTCFLFRLNYIGIPQPLVDLLKSNRILKIGLSLRDDFGAIRKRVNITPVHFLDLQVFVKPFGIEDASLQKIYAIVFQKKISKTQRLSNWEAEKLTGLQQKYAALDAWACLKIYNRLKATR